MNSFSLQFNKVLLKLVVKKMRYQYKAFWNMHMLHVSDTSLECQWFSSFGVVTESLMYSAKEPGFKWSPIILYVLGQLRRWTLVFSASHYASNIIDFWCQRPKFHQYTSDS